MKKTTTRPTAADLAAALNAYEGQNIWQDVIEATDYDREATEAADPRCTSAIVIMADGSRVEHDGESWSA